MTASEPEMTAARAVAYAINTGDVTLFFQLLAEDVRFETQSGFQVWQGKSDVEPYMRELCESVYASETPASADVAIADHVDGGVGVKITRDHVVRSFWSLTLDENHQIASIFGITVAPSPAEARGLNEWPGLDRNRLLEMAAKKQQALRNILMNSGTPLRFIGIALAEFQLPFVQKLVGQCIKRFGGEANIHVFENENEAKQLELQRYSLLHFPELVVVKGEHIIRSSRKSLNFDQIERDLSELGL